MTESNCWLSLPPEMAHDVSCEKLEVIVWLFIFLMLLSGIMYLFEAFDLCRWAKRSTPVLLPSGFLRPTRECSTLWWCWYCFLLFAVLVSAAFLLFPSIPLFFLSLMSWLPADVLRSTLFGDPPRNYEELPPCLKR